jgi:hypothetical protein
MHSKARSFYRDIGFRIRFTNPSNLHGQKLRAALALISEIISIRQLNRPIFSIFHAIATHALLI